MHDPDSERKKSNVLRFRASDTTEEYVEHLRDEWGCSSKSEALRILVHSYIGVLHGGVSGTLDQDKLMDRWGDSGTVIALMLNEDTPTPDSIEGARLSEVLSDVPILLGAAREEADIVPYGEQEGQQDP